MDHTEILLMMLPLWLSAMNEPSSGLAGVPKENATIIPKPSFWITLHR